VGVERGGRRVEGKSGKLVGREEGGVKVMI
jgi:hypothetical protein